MPKPGSGRSGTGHARYRRNRAILLASTDICAICGHPGAITADHIIPDKIWRQLFPDDRFGFDELANLQPAHGCFGAGVRTELGRCPTCGRMCNQSKKDSLETRRPQSRQWRR